MSLQTTCTIDVHNLFFSCTNKWLSMESLCQIKEESESRMSCFAPCVRFPWLPKLSSNYTSISPLSLSFLPCCLLSASSPPVVILNLFPSLAVLAACCLSEWAPHLHLCLPLSLTSCRNSLFFFHAVTFSWQFTVSRKLQCTYCIQERI